MAGIDANSYVRPARDGMLAGSHRPRDPNRMWPTCAVDQEGPALPAIVVSDDEVCPAVRRGRAAAA
jgi:hypothetical protein